MKIAFVRGPFLNPWELQTYLPLAGRHDFKAIGADWQVFDQAFTRCPVPVERAHVWAASFARFHPHLPTLLNRLRSWTLGESYGLTNLDDFAKNADILHSAETFSTMTYQCLQIKRRRACKVVATIWENIPHMGERHPWRRARKREAIQTLDGFLAVTATSRRMLVEEGAPADRIEVIPMAVDLTHFKPMPRDAAWAARWGLQPGEKVVLFVGRWVTEKGIPELLQSISHVLKDVSVPVRFCFAGAGPLEKRLEQAARDFPGRVLLIPFLPYEQLPILHNMADIFVLPSKPLPKWEEQFGYVLAESMACGKAIVTTRSGSIPDVVSDAALLVPPGDAGALSLAMIHLLTTPNDRLRLAELARQRALAHFDARTNAARIEAFYERILKTPR